MSVVNQNNPPLDTTRPFSEPEASTYRFLALVQESTDVFWVLTPDGEMQGVCASWQTFTGQKQCEYRGQNWRDALHPAELPEIDEGLMQAVTTRHTSKVTCQIRHFNGNYRSLQLRIIPVRMADESVGELVICGKGITKRKLSLRMSEAQVQLALKTSHVGMWDWDVIADQMTWTDQCKALFGWSVSTSVSYRSFLAALHPDDRERIDHLHSQALNGKVEFRAEYRVIWPDESIHWIADRAKSIFNARGRAVHMVGASIDITELKQAEEQAREAFAYYNR